MKKLIVIVMGMVMVMVLAVKEKKKYQMKETLRLMVYLPLIHKN
jgi:hypothetical protein